MTLLALSVTATHEPLGVVVLPPSGDPEYAFVDQPAQHRAMDTLAAWEGDPDALARELPDRLPTDLFWSLVEPAGQDPWDELERLRKLWASTTASTGTPTFEAAARRIRFTRGRARSLAAFVLGGSAHTFYPGRRVSATLSFWAAPDDEALAAVVVEGEKPADIDKALAFGLAYQDDRDLHILVPAGVSTKRGLADMSVADATAQRIAYLTTPIRLWTYEDDTIEPVAIPPRHHVLAATRLDGELPVGARDLGNRLGWIAGLVNWAEADAGLDPAHRASYLAWHHEGRMLLKAEATRDGLRLTAGIDYASHRTDKQPATICELTGPLAHAETEQLMAAIRQGQADRQSGVDTENLEHRLQAALATSHGQQQLGLAGPPERELPATRPGQRRAYVDLTGVDPHGDIHIIETKLDADAMLGLQGLDYWAWATANYPALVQVLREQGHQPTTDARFRLDYVVGTKADTDAPPDLRYLVPQLEALDPSISWRVGIVTGWRHQPAEPHIHWYRPRQLPDLDPPRQPRFARRLQDHLVDQAQANGNLTRRVFHDDLDSAVLPGAQPVLHRLQDQGLDHRFVSHVRSSQLFAINLFATLQGDALVALARQLCPEVVAVDRVEFEFTDPLDRLGEAKKATGHATQADVALFTTDGGGGRRLVLIEVKLTEDDFGHCTAYQDPNNDRLDLCAQPGAFGGDPDGCFKLRNHNRGGRRTYDHYVSATAALPAVGCAFRLSANQPMRYAALAGSLLEAEEVDSATIALCAHDHHQSIWRRWHEATQTINAHLAVSFRDLPASQVLRELDPRIALELADRYDLPNPSSDHQRLSEAVSWARTVLARVSTDGSVLDQLEQALNDQDRDHGALPGSRELAQRLELLAESARSMRADLVLPADEH